MNVTHESPMKEHQQIEWKESWRDEYLKWICGFANADGGILHIGRNDKGVIVGVQNATKLLEDLPNKVRDILGIMVDVNLKDESGKEWIEIRVEPYPSPISFRGEYHYRSGSTKQELKGPALEHFLLRKRGRHWDGVPEPGFKIKDCSEDAIHLFSQKAARSKRMNEAVLKDSREVILGNLELIEGPYLKRAASLLFSNQEKPIISGAWIKIGFFVTDDNLRYQDEIHGNLFEQVDKTLELLHSKYLKAYISYEGVQRLETFLFPYAALREALLNAVVHKDYSSGIPILISVYEGKIVIWNAGVLPQDWTIERLMGKHPSCPFNPLLANTFFRSGYIESWGRGIEKINRECLSHGIDSPTYDYSMSGLMLTFHANPKHLSAGLNSEETKRVPDLSSVKTSVKTSVKILELLNENPEMTLAEIAVLLGKSTRGIEMASTKLVREGRLKRVGPAKGGHWQIIK